MAPTRLTIGMATHRGFDGVYFTVNALRLYYAEVLPRCEIVIVDNDPDGPQAQQLRGFCAQLEARRPGWPRPFAVQYVPYREAIGTAAPRDHIFRVAQGGAVLVLDSHVNLWPGALAKLLDWYDANPDSEDLVQGPLVYDDLVTISTHFADVWRDGMWGTWDTDPRGVDPAAPPFEIPAQGLGLFSCRKSAWLGFNPHFRESGGEEWYIHEKFRQAGRRCLCLPFLRWVHRFSAPAAGRAYQTTVAGRIRNYILGLQELGLSLDRLRRHCVDGLNEDPHDPINRAARLTEDRFAALVRDPVRYPVGLDDDHPGQTEPAAGVATNGHAHANAPAVLLEDLYRRAAGTPSDINEHCSKLRELASQCETVVEFGMRHSVSTVALLAGQPRRLLTVTNQPDPILDELRVHAGATQFEFRRGSSLDTDAPDCDLLFLDTKHTADYLTQELHRHVPRVRRWIALHDTDIFGERGEDGGPGLLSALRGFLEREPEWKIVYHTRVNHGLTVISRQTNDISLVPIPGDKAGIDEAFEQSSALQKSCPSGNDSAAQDRGGDKHDLRIPFLNLQPALEPIVSQIREAIDRVLLSGVFLRGPETDAFEWEWAAFCGQKHCVTCASGTDALTLAAAALDLTHADIPANTLPLTALGLHRAGCFVTPAEVRDDGRLAVVTADSVPVLLYGRDPSPEELTCRLFDAAHAHGWQPPTQAVACWSFYPTKTLGALGDAGAVTTNDASLAQTLRDLAGRDDVLRDRRQLTSRMDELQAAVLRIKLRHLPAWLEARRQIAAAYHAGLPSTWPVDSLVSSRQHLFVIRTSIRSELMEWLQVAGIGHKVHFPVPLHRQDAPWGDSRPRPQAEAWCQEVLSLPCWPGLDLSDVRAICEYLQRRTP